MYNDLLCVFRVTGTFHGRPALATNITFLSFCYPSYNYSRDAKRYCLRIYQGPGTDWCPEMTQPAWIYGYPALYAANLKGSGFADCMSNMSG